MDMVVLDASGAVLEGKLKPSSDAPTHLELYRAFPELGGIVHTHSSWATVWAQACRGIPALGTTHADYFFGEIPCTQGLTAQQIAGQYEAQTGVAIIDRLLERGLTPTQMPAVLVAKRELSILTDRLGDDKVRIRIIDTGRGMAPDHVARIFDPVLSQDPLGKGSGLGLWLASRSVERHHGEIEVWSQVGSGTRFTITLPIGQPDAHGA